ncbi:serine/threonine-protein kinase [Sorangium sp. So ce1151]|uniref:serine/threonine-protein kinase n=1 Tax=Sorangium sp. So ce1151 TaxID=3133332 RepID=UPI003F60CCA2
MLPTAELTPEETAVISGRPQELETSAAGDALPAGAVVGGYLLDEVRLAGGFGVVHRAWPLEGGAAVALKVLRRELSLLPAMLRRFQQEAEVLARLRHPAIVEIRGVGALDDGRPYIAMEWLEGRSLAAELRARGAFSPGEAVALIEEIGGALAAAHAIGVVHRDVKAQNVMVRGGLFDSVAGGGGAGGVKLVDFGIAKLLQPPGGARGGKSSSLILGTPLTMAPEQILGGAVDARTDIYALGLLAYQLVTAELPFQGANAVETEEMHLRAPPPLPSERAPVSAAFDAVVRRCLAKDPAGRYASVPELLAALRGAVSAPGVGAPRVVAPCVGAPARAGVDERARRGPSTALLVEAGLAAQDDAGDEELADVERLLQAARAALSRIGATLVVESADALLATLPAPYEGAPDRALGWVLGLWAELGARAGASPEVHPRLALHAATLEALRRWAPGPTGAGVFVTDAFAEGLAGKAAAATRPAAGGALRRVSP